MGAILEFPLEEAMKKSDRIEAFVENLGAAGEGALDRHYLAYFQCFNDQLYYEAHDVLEHLWLQEKAVNTPSATFYKGLIQLAGAFVHLKKQYLRPDHPTDGRRLRPAARLFQLARGNLAAYRPEYLSLDVSGVLRFCDGQIDLIEAAHFAVNPWSPESAPALRLQG